MHTNKTTALLLLFVFIRTTNGVFLCFLRRKSSSCLFHQLVSAGLTSDQEGIQEEPAVSRDLVEASARYFSNDPMSTKQAKFAADERGAVFGLSGVGSRLREEHAL